MYAHFAGSRDGKYSIACKRPKNMRRDVTLEATVYVLASEMYNP